MSARAAKPGDASGASPSLPVQVRLSPEVRMRIMRARGRRLTATGLDVNVSEWIREAIEEKLMIREQLYERLNSLINDAPDHVDIQCEERSDGVCTNVATHLALREGQPSSCVCGEHARYYTSTRTIAGLAPRKLLAFRIRNLASQLRDEFFPVPRRETESPR